MAKKTFEVGGKTFQISEPKIRQITEYAEGDTVKVLVKQYSDQFSCHPGIVVGIEPFENMPTVVIAYLEGGYSPDVKLLHFNKVTAEKQSVEICPACPDELILCRQDILATMDRQIETKRLEVLGLEQKRAYVLKRFAPVLRDKDEVAKDNATN